MSERPEIPVHYYDPGETQAAPQITLKVGDRIDLGDGFEAVVSRVLPVSDGAAASFRLSLPPEVETWGDGNRKVPGETFDEYNARMAAALDDLGEPLARNADGSLDCEPPCICGTRLAESMACPRHLAI